MFDVHIGFMDEEVKPVLEQLLRLDASATSSGVNISTTKTGGEAVSFRSVIDRLFLVNHDRPIYVIERDDIKDSSSLFQMIDNQYTLPWDYKAVVELPESGSAIKPPVLNTRRDPTKTPGVEFTFKLAKSLGKAAADTDFALQVTSLWNSANKTKLAHLPRMTYTVCAFNCKSPKVDHRNPVIIVRAPEMGLQPELIRLNLKTIMLALGRLQLPGSSSNRSAANVYMYGAGGAMGEGTKPGKLQHIMGSVYIGAEVDSTSLVGKAELARGGGGRKERTESLQQKWVGLVAFACPDSHIVMYASPPQATFKAAMDLAKEEFKSRRLQLPLENCTRLVKRLYPSYSVSLTASGFIGGDLKAAARAQGLNGDCNMEDYHVLRIMHEMRYGVGMPRLFNHGLARIDCDPPHIPEQLFTAFKKWAKEARWTREHYIEGILWGLRGVTYGSVNWAFAHWGYADQVSALHPSDMDKYVYTVKHEGVDRVLCPFYTEVACDLVETTATKGPAAVFGAAHTAVTGFPELKTLAQGLQRDAVQALRTAEGTLELRTQIGAFVDAFGRILTTAGLKEASQDSWPIWARPGWDGAEWGKETAWAVAHVSRTGTDAAINSVWDEHFPDEKPNGNLDRALYKSTNMMALQVLAPTGSEKIVHGHQYSNVMDELKARYDKEWKPRLEQQNFKKVDRMATARQMIAGREAYLREVEERDALIKNLFKQLTSARNCKPSSPFDQDGPPPPPAVF
jgi:hypothetical protein